MLIHNKDSHKKRTYPNNLGENEKDYPFLGNSLDLSAEEELFSEVNALVSRKQNNLYIVYIENSSYSQVPIKQIYSFR